MLAGWLDNYDDDGDHPDYHFGDDDDDLLGDDDSEEDYLAPETWAALVGAESQWNIAFRFTNDLLGGYPLAPLGTLRGA